ncbi:hypothetical protein NHM07_09140 [Bacillus subtilis]|uniref:hypothetical protein n=1 Tax=Bacillus subtilis TaxID=1423 RepID=UPI0003AAD70E|nr:hypothetical protein [Bacillus subtilis]MCO8148710.1 hypothetical protein [Bacillus subtilis]MDY7217250.1 hypothetical protein [Bacillus subtilis]MEC2177144.1 hypothetical protein [Bacillus subtilis]MEC3649522.1 hypothetical protein [Bacillus subtilis]RPK03671.1 hypothetical protein EH11_00071 [Bacillus subtilis]
MHAPLSLLKQMLKEHQIDTEKAVTFEEYMAVRLKLQELMGKFASIGEWDLYQKAADLMMHIGIQWMK